MRKGSKMPLRSIRRGAWLAMKRLGRRAGGGRPVRIPWNLFNHDFMELIKPRPWVDRSKYTGRILRQIRARGAR
jgi:hypothetical protein